MVVKIRIVDWIESGRRYVIEVEIHVDVKITAAEIVIVWASLHVRGVDKRIIMIVEAVLEERYGPLRIVHER